MKFLSSSFEKNEDKKISLWNNGTIKNRRWFMNQYNIIVQQLSNAAQADCPTSNVMRNSVNIWRKIIFIFHRKQLVNGLNTFRRSIIGKNVISGGSISDNWLFFKLPDPYRILFFIRSSHPMIKFRILWSITWICILKTVVPDMIYRQIVWRCKSSLLKDHVLFFRDGNNWDTGDFFFCNWYAVPYRLSLF